MNIKVFEIWNLRNLPFVYSKAQEKPAHPPQLHVIYGLQTVKFSKSSSKIFFLLQYHVKIPANKIKPFTELIILVKMTAK